MMNFDMLTVGQTFETKNHKVTKEEIITFASQYDPQYMHVDPEKAKKSIFKGIIASGLHTLNLSFKLWIDLKLFEDKIIAGTGIDKLRFTKPVYPGDVLNVVATVIGKQEREDVGEVTILLSTYKNDGAIQVLKAEISALISK